MIHRRNKPPLQSAAEGYTRTRNRDVAHSSSFPPLRNCVPGVPACVLVSSALANRLTHTAYIPLLTFGLDSLIPITF